MLQLPYQTVAQLPANHEIRLLIRQIIFLAAESPERRQTPLHMSQKIVQLMYKATTQLGREIYVAILDQLCHTFEEVAKEAISWLIYSDDEVMSSQIPSPNVIDSPIAQIQRCRHCYVAQKWVNHPSSIGSTTCKIHVRAIPAELTYIHRKPHPRVSHV